MTARAALACAIALASPGCANDAGLRSIASFGAGEEPTAAWTFDGLTHGVAWEEGTGEAGLLNVFDGYGAVTVRDVGGSGALVLTPGRAEVAAQTHAALVVTEEDVGARMELAVGATTLAQLRPGAPNPWETAWVVWSYVDPQNFYYLALKTNGWEIGKRDPRYPGGQRFLADARDEGFAVGQRAEVSVRQEGAAFAVEVDGFLLAEVQDDEDPLLGGAVGLYTEDAAVAFDDLAIWR